MTAAAGRFEEPSSAAGNVVIEVRPDEASVAAFLCDTVEAAAAKAVAERGVFTLAIPGGSVLKALKGLAGRAMPWDKVRRQGVAAAAAVLSPWCRRQHAPQHISPLPCNLLPRRLASSL